MVFTKIEDTKIFEKSFSTYEYLGAHRVSSENGLFFSYSFRIRDHRAKSVFVFGDFNDGKMLNTEKITDNGIFECVYKSDIPIEGMRYKYRIEYDKRSVLVSDPFAAYYERNGDRASIVYVPDPFDWQDERFMTLRKNKFFGREAFYSSPINIYEMHMGSWQTLDGRSNLSGDAYMNYREIAEKLSRYISSAGYTHIELVGQPSNELFPENSCAGLIAPSSLFGTPEDFKAFVDTLHRASVGVIVDFSVRKDFETDIFVSAALFWIREFHIDGVKLDCCGDFEKNEVEKLFSVLNDAVYGEFPDVMTILGETSDFVNATLPVKDGGLGFTFKWNCGWGNDVLNYFAEDAFLRSEKYRFLTFSTKYSFSENFILGISHERVKKGKKALVDKFFGTYSEKFATAKAFLVYMMSHPGKKLLFMGCEFGQVSEWDAENQLEWFMTDFDFHSKLQKFVFDMNRFYKERRELYETDTSKSGFSWIVNERNRDNVIAYERKTSFGRRLLFVFNFSPMKYRNYKIPCGFGGLFYREIINTDLAKYGGDDISNKGLLTVCDGDLSFDLPPLSALVFEPFEPHYEEIGFEVIKS